ncbi:MAG: hypothetical protein M0018_03005 [Nitrospiraceae bacterium]|nr:hypothetical protein [Nitrospiraceae bacterium]
MGIEEKAGQNDQTIEKNGLKVYMDAQTLNNLKDTEMDFVEEGGGSGFVLKNTSPNYSAPDCGSCGSHGSH